MKYPDFDKEFILATDASNVAIGAVLGQLDELGKEHPVAYASRVLNKAERKPQRTVDRAIAILDKALQGVPWEERDQTLDLLEWDWQEEERQTP